MPKFTGGANGGNAGRWEDGGGDAGWANGGGGEDTSIIKLVMADVRTTLVSVWVAEATQVGQPRQ
jgi:hypothetical protein